MKAHSLRYFRRSVLAAAAVVMLVVLTACRGLGGGQLPPNVAYTGPGSFGFTFSCEDKGGINPSTGKLQIELAYVDHGTSQLILAPFSIHGIVDVIDPVVESAVCSGPNPPAPPNTVTFLGRYSLTSSAPAGFPSTCPARETKKTPLCRFEVTVIDNDLNHAPSPGDYFSIKLSTSTSCPDGVFSCSQLPPATVFYTRDGLLTAGNITVD